MSLSLTDLRLRARIAARNAQDMSNYNTSQLDDAIDRLLGRFLRVTRVVKLAVSVDFIADDNEADFSALAGFLPDRIERARVDEDDNYTDVRGDLARMDAATVLNYLNDPSTAPPDIFTQAATGTPEAIGFTDSTTAAFFPQPTNDGTLSVTYSPLQTPWTIGTRGAWDNATQYFPLDVVSSAGSIYQAISTNTNVAVSTTATWINLGSGTLVAPANIVSVIPDGLLTELLGTGIAPMLQAIDPKQQAFVGQQWASYLAFEKECKAMGSLSGNVHFQKRVNRG